MALAERCGLADLAAEHVRIAAACGVNAHLKTGCLVAGMAAGADSIDDMDVLRDGAMGELFGGVRAPSTLGSFLRSFTWGNVLQLQKVHREFLAELSRHAPQAPRMKAICERLICTLRREVLDRTLILNQAHLRAVLAEYQEHYNTARPHQGIGQRVPDPGPAPRGTATDPGTCLIRRRPVLSGLINEYERAA